MKIVLLLFFNYFNDLITYIYIYIYIKTEHSYFYLYIKSY